MRTECSTRLDDSQPDALNMPIGGESTILMDGIVEANGYGIAIFGQKYHKGT